MASQKTTPLIKTRHIAASGDARNKHHIFAYLMRASFLYLAFNLFLSPISLWKDIFISGWLYGRADLIHAPFVQGSFLFYSIVLNSDSIFRALHGKFVMKSVDITTGIISGIVANIIFIAFAFLLLLSRQEDLAAHSASSTGIPSVQSPAMHTDMLVQILILSASLVLGLVMSLLITSIEAANASPVLQGEL
jgi:hypothetical protein